MSKRGPYDFPPKGPESDEDQESETQPEIPPGADLATADQGGVPVQHQSSESELPYRLSQPSHQSTHLQPLYQQLESASSFTPALSVPPSLHSTHRQFAPSLPFYFSGRRGQVTGSHRSSQFSLPSDSSSPAQLIQNYRFYLQSCWFYYLQSYLQYYSQFSSSDRRQLYQPFQSYQQLQPYGQFQSSPSLQSVAPDLAVAPFSSMTKQGSTRRAPQNPAEKTTRKRTYPCTICYRASFDSEIDLEKHIESEHKTKRCRIDNCTFKTLDQEVLKQHQGEEHGQLDTPNIQVPNQGAAKPDSLTSSDPLPSLSSSEQGNVATSSNPQQTSMVICEIDNCNRFFEEEDGFLIHVARLHAEKQCTKCYFHSTSEQKLKDHMIQDHPDSSEAIQEVSLRTSSPGPNLQHPVSNTSPSSSQPNLSPGQGKPTHRWANQCGECGEQKGSEDLFLIHIKMHLPHKCLSCTTFYESLKGLEDHNGSIFHTRAGDLRIYCKHCHDEFTTLREFKRHCEYVMIDKVNQICPICGVSYKNRYTMINHYTKKGDEHFDEHAQSLVTKKKETE